MKWYKCLICGIFRTQDKRTLVKHIKDHGHTVPILLVIPLFFSLVKRFIDHFLPYDKYPEVLRRKKKVKERGWRS